MNPATNPSSSRESNSEIHRTAVRAPRSANDIAQANLIDAILNHDERNFDTLLDNALSEGASLDTIDEYGFIPLEIAALNNKPRVVQSLLSRGSFLPLVPSNGFDLAMLAASQGHTALLLVLLDVGQMLPNGQDKWGATPLHYAVIGGHLQSAAALLERGADTEMFTTYPIDTALRRHSNIPDIVGNAGTTPLMLAVAMRNYALTELLLSHGASHLGCTRHPIEIAVLNNDFRMLELLLERDLDPNSIQLIDGRSLLTLSIQNHCSLALIKELVLSAIYSPHGPGTLEVPLQTAIQTGQHDVVAYLICQGAKPESAPTSSSFSWSLAANLNDQGKMLNILIAHRADEAIKIFTRGGVSLSSFCQFAAQPATFSAHGIFPEVLAPVLPALQALLSRSQNLSPAQIQFEVAYCLYLLKTPQEGTNTASSISINNLLNSSDEIELIKTIPKKIASQIKELQRVGKNIVINKQNVLIHVLSRDFFSDMLRKFSGTSHLMASIAHQLMTEDGLPNHVAEVIAIAWITAHEKTQQIPVNPNTINNLSQHTETRMLLVMENILVRKIHDGTMARHVETFCLNVLLNSVTSVHSLVHQFVSDPVRFLQDFNKSTAEKKLTTQQCMVQLCTQLGLSMTVCQKIYNEWELATADVAIDFSSVHTSAAQEFLSKTMAASLKRIFTEPNGKNQEGDIIMPLRLRDQLLQWCDTVLTQDDEYQARLNDQQRPAKRARFNE